MPRLFEEFPRLESERLLLREWQPSDAPALEAILRDPAVYRYLPTFLYEQSVADTAQMIRGARSACFDTKEIPPVRRLPAGGACRGDRYRGDLQL